MGRVYEGGKSGGPTKAKMPKDFLAYRGKTKMKGTKNLGGVGYRFEALEKMTTSLSEETVKNKWEKFWVGGGGGFGVKGG